MGMFEYFYNFMLHVISFITSTPVIYLFFCVFFLWSISLFFKIVRG